LRSVTPRGAAGSGRRRPPGACWRPHRAPQGGVCVFGCASLCALRMCTESLVRCATVSTHALHTPHPRASLYPCLHCGNSHASAGPLRLPSHLGIALHVTFCATPASPQPSLSFGVQRANPAGGPASDNRTTPSSQLPLALPNKSCSNTPTAQPFQHDRPINSATQPQNPLKSHTTGPAARRSGAAKPVGGSLPAPAARYRR
jgi:hypothetical protein